MDFTSWNEQDVREEIIAPLLRRLGYKKGTENNIRRGDQLKLEYAKEILGTPKKKDRPQVGFPDYILDAGSKRWVIDAKSPDCQIGKWEIWQAYSYAKHHEVRAVCFCLCNGKELQIYSTNNKPENAHVKTIKYEDFESDFDTIANILSPETIRRAWPEVEIDMGKPLGPGLRSFARITGGSFTYTSNSLQNPLLNDLLFTVTGGFIERRQGEKLFAFITTRSPIASAQLLAEQMGFNKMELLSEDTVASTDQAKPNIFTSTDSFRIPRGARILNANYPFDVDGWSKTTIRGWLYEGAFSGTFEALMHMGRFGQVILKGTFEVFLV